MGTVQRNATDAEESCQSKGGKLFEPQTSSMNDQIYNKAREIMGDGNWVCFGINDNENEGQWVYNSNNAPVPYQDAWKDGYPRDNDSSNCAQFQTTSNPDWQEWMDKECRYNCAYICEF